MESKYDKIGLSVPFKAEYVSVVRLTTSGIASRIGFNIDDIEDIKVAISEVCNKLITSTSHNTDSFNINFHIYKDCLKVYFECDDKSLKCVFDDKGGELGLSIINALMDDVELCTNGNYVLAMSKSIRENL